MHKKVGGPLTEHDFENGLNQVFISTDYSTSEMTSTKNE